MRLALKTALLMDGRPAWKIAAAAGVNAARLSGITRGRHIPRPDECDRLAEVLGRDVREVFPDVHRPTPAPAVA